MVRRPRSRHAPAYAWLAMVASVPITRISRVFDEAGYVDVHKSVGGSRVRTSLSLTGAGRAAYDGHIAALRAIVSNERLPADTPARGATG